jgi:hypothetical protein
MSWPCGILAWPCTPPFGWCWWRRVGRGLQVRRRQPAQLLLHPDVTGIRAISSRPTSARLTPGNSSERIAAPVQLFMHGLDMPPDGVPDLGSSSKSSRNGLSVTRAALSFVWCGSEFEELLPIPCVELRPNWNMPQPGEWLEWNNVSGWLEH